MLSSFNKLDTNELDYARYMVGQQFCSHKLILRDSANHFRVRQNLYKGKVLSLSYLSYGAKVAIEPGELENFYLLQIPLSAGAEITNGGNSFTSDCNTAAILNPDRNTKIVWHSECEQLMVYVSKQNLLAVAENHFNRSLPGDLVFNSKVNLTRPALSQLRDRIFLLANDVENASVEKNSANQFQKLIEEQILVNLLINQPGNVQCFNDPVQRTNLSGSVKKAVDYIKANVNNQISVGDISASAQVPIRTLQHHFLNTFGMSPTAFLVNERLSRVHFELTSGDHIRSINDVAKRWGFSHPGRFSRQYRQRFGQTPSHSMKQSRQLKRE